MATAAGYLVLEGISFEQLVWFCARAFIERDDQSLDVLDEDTIARKKASIDELKTDLRQWTDATDAQLQARKEAAFAANNEMFQKCHATWKLENAAIDAMLNKLESWQPPPAVPAELKAYLIDQMKISKHGDPDAWLANSIAQMSWTTREDQIRRLKTQIREDEHDLRRTQTRLAQRRSWVTQLEQQIPRPDNFKPPGK